MLQQAGHLIAEGALGVEGMLERPAFGVVAAAEVDHPAAQLEQPGQQRPHHAVEPHRPLAAAHHQQQRAGSLGHPAGEGCGLQERAPHRGARDPRAAPLQALRRLRQSDGDLAAEPSQQPRHFPGDAIGFMQHHRHPTPAGREDCRCRDVAAGAEDQADPLPADQTPDRNGGAQQAQQVGELAQTPSLETAGFDGVQADAPRHQLGLQPIGDPQPLDLPIRGQRLGDGEGWKEMPAGAAGSDQQA